MTPRSARIWLLAALVGGPLWAQSGTDTEALLWRGIDAMYSYRYAESTAALDSVMTIDPLNAVAPFVAVANQWLRSLTEEGYAASHQALQEAIKATIPRYEMMLALEKQRPDALLYLGTTYGLQARIALSQKRWITVVTAGFRGWRLVQRAHALDDGLLDAYLPIGIFDYYTGSSGGPVRLVARILGMNPDKQRGIAKLQRAGQEAPHAWIEATSTLAILQLYIEDEPHQALLQVDRLVDHYPDNYYFRFLRGDALVRAGRLEDARSYLPQLSQMLSTAHPNQQLEWQLKLASLEATLAFEAGEWEHALERSEWVIGNYSMEFDWHLGFALFIRGRVREQQGDLRQALQDYRRVAGLDNHTYAVADARAAIARVKARIP